jgi:hypothetical protein
MRVARSDMSELPKLPIGIQTFQRLREDGYLYVDKTKYLVDMASAGKAYFLSRPRRFGKSLTVSTFDALFSGKKGLFKGLYAEKFFERPGYKIRSVVKLDMSGVTAKDGMGEFKEAILDQLERNASDYDLKLERTSPCRAFAKLMNDIYRAAGPVVVLVDEYDKPILDFIDVPDMADEVRRFLRDFYIQIKSADEFVHFVFMTGIAKFSKMGVFSALNNLKDISANDAYSTMLGYTDAEVRDNFDPHIKFTSDKFGISSDELLCKMKDYYDGFSFDGKNRLYNPFSTLNFFDEGKFKNFWFETATPSFLAEYVKRKDLEAESFRGLVRSEDFMDIAEIERASPESFLYQSGYLSLREKAESMLTLDYPNKEVLSGVARLFMYCKFDISGAVTAAGKLEIALARGDSAALAKFYDALLMSIPHSIYERENRKYNRTGETQNILGALPLAESFYHAVLFAMLWASRVNTRAEAETYWGDSDIEAEINGRRYVVELKVIDGEHSAEHALDTAMRQIREKGYADKYSHSGGAELIGIAVDRAKRRVAGYRTEKLAPEA